MFQVCALERKYSWITEEKQYFGSAGGSYDFKEKDPHETGKHISKLQEKSDKLSRNINTRAMNLLGKQEEQVRCSGSNCYHVGFRFTSC
jgi:structural maintenance of chromosome 2